MFYDEQDLEVQIVNQTGRARKTFYPKASSVLTQYAMNVGMNGGDNKGFSDTWRQSGNSTMRGDIDTDRGFPFT